MNFVESFQLALKNISASKMRTFLTMLGIIIGVMAVMVIVGLGNGMKQYMEDSFSDLGTNTLNIMITGRGSSRSVSVDDMYEIVKEHPEALSYVSPMVSMSGGAKVGTEKDASTSVTGVSEDYFKIKSYDISAGRGISYVDISTRRHVCVIGSYLADTYYDGNAVGKIIKVGANNLTIIGVMAQESDSTPEKGGTDDAVYLPYSTAARLSSMGTISTYIITAIDKDHSAAGKTIVENALFDVFDDEDAYAVISMAEMLDMMNSMIGVLVTILTIIAAISLLVGGIGIMNIMLVSVTERTKEIGIRKALGAKERYIMQQFVIEAATTSALGGLVGIILGFIISAIASAIIPVVLDADMSVQPSLTSILVAFGISTAIGIIFGYLPAKKAARLNPIDALRNE